MPRHGENIYRRKDGRWEGRYFIGKRSDGRTAYRSIYGKRYGDVKKELLLRKAELYAGGQSAACPGKGVLFEDRAAYYLVYKAKPFVKESTYAQYQRLVAHYLIPAFGMIPLARLEPETIQRYFSNQIGVLSNGTLHNIFSMLRAILSDAFQDKKIAARVWENIRLPHRDRPRVRVLSRAEQIAFERLALQKGAHEFIVCLYTGIRLGELCALQWEDVRWKERKLAIRHSLQRITRDGASRVVIGTPKSASSVREIPLPPFLYDMLRGLYESAPKGGRFIFSGKNGEARDMRTEQARFKRLADKLGIEGAHVHTLRHSFATRCLENGVGVETLSALLGHSVATVTLRYYAHSTEESRVESIRDLTLLSE